MARLFPNFEIIMNRKPLPTEGELTLLNFLVNNYDDSYEIFFQPFLNGDLPDIVLMREGGGVMIFEVKDWDLSNYYVDEKGHWIVKVNNSIYKKNPLQQVLHYKENLYNLHIDGLLDLKLKDYKHWYIVNCAVYFHCQNTEFANNFCIGNNPTDKYKTFVEKNFSIIGKDGLNKSYFNQLFYKTWISRKSYYFNDDLYNSFSRYFKPSLHTIEEGQEIIMSNDQKILSQSIAGERKRIKGVAGSGKTLVLAQRAVNAHKRTHLEVLILTYNITLRNYIHDRISSVREDFDWKCFHISNYHDFIKNQMNNHEIPFVIPNDFDFWDEEQKENFFEQNYFSNIYLFSQVKEETKRYNAVLIDETQDYKEIWIRIIKDYFATPDAEIVVFADEKQNIYARTLEMETKMPIIPIQVGQWDKRLNKSYRLSNKIALLATTFQKKFFSKKYSVEERIETNSMFSLFDEPSFIEYHYFNNENDEDITNYIFKQIMEHKFHSNDVTILSSRIKMLRGLNDKLQQESKEKTNIMFETVEEFQQFCPYAITGYEKNKEIERIRKNRKANFWMNRGTFKLSTIHSFKGWESPVLFLVVENNLKNNEFLYETKSKETIPDIFSDELVYTGFTRCRNTLFIINVGNNEYDNFFANNSLIDKKITSSNIISEQLINDNFDKTSIVEEIETPDVYIVGYEWHPPNKKIAKIWKNGVGQRLSNEYDASEAKSVYVYGSDVYVAGYIDGVATLWKNGIAQTLAEDNRHSKANSVFVSKDNVYVAGHIDRVATLWKNGIAQNLADDNSSSKANSVFVSENDVYVAGYIDRVATLWRNGTPQKLAENKGSEANSIFVYDSDVYVAGVVGGVATMWKNGVVQNLTDKDDYSNTNANSIFVYDKDVYVAGLWDTQEPCSVLLWKNGVEETLKDDSFYSCANSVFVSNSDVYVVGYGQIQSTVEHYDNETLGQSGLYSPENRVAMLWKNGVRQNLTDGSDYSCAISIFVQTPEQKRKDESKCEHKRFAYEDEQSYWNSLFDVYNSEISDSEEYR